jgi:hypothetical protein
MSDDPRHDLGAGEDPDGLDARLRTRLLEAAPPVGPLDAPAELRDLTPRFRAARRRHRAAVGTMASAAAIALVVLGAVSLGPSDRQAVDTADDPSLVITTTTIERAGRTTVAPTTVPTAPTITVPAAPPPTAPAAGSAPATTTTQVPFDPTPRRPSGGGSTASPTPTTVVPSVPTTAPASGSRVVAAAGGTVSLTWTPSSLTVTATDPAPGWALDRVVRKSATRVVVTFTRPGGGSGSNTSTVDARVEGGGLRVDS